MPNPGFRIFTQIRRPATSLVAAFEGIPVANISDNMGRLASMSAAIKPYGRPRLLGVAITVKAPVGDNLMFHRAIDLAEAGDVIVVDGQGDMNHSLCGEIMMRYAKRKGISGFVIDGCIRDVEGLRELDFPVYARGVTPKGPYKNGPGEINVPVVCGGQAVLPGDILVGDGDGIVVIRPEDAEWVLAKAREHNAMEMRTFQAIEGGTLDRSWVVKTLTEKGCEVR
ncbi:MAG: RraA family protein [Spirochaetes bacterium]|nr:RraA family protein [Spirochaetota bacterium]